MISGIDALATTSATATRVRVLEVIVSILRQPRDCGLHTRLVAAGPREDDLAVAARHARIAAAAVCRDVRDGDRWRAVAARPDAPHHEGGAAIRQLDPRHDRRAVRRQLDVDA